VRDRGLARTVRGDGQRVHKHKHVLDEAWSLEGLPLALMSVLMLRGAQTVAELRTRTERYLPGGRADDREVEAALEQLSAREPPFVELLSRRPGERESRWIHRLGDVAAPAGGLPDPAAGDHESSSGPQPRRQHSGDGASDTRVLARLDDVAARLDALTARFDDVTARLDALTVRFDALESDLGAG
jgi:uncharacterized protein YceH (UPF0502 family)